MVYLQQIPWNKPCELGNQCHHDMACGHIPTHLPWGNAPQSQVEFHQCLHLEIFYPHMLVVPHSINLKCSALERIYQTRFWDFELSKLWNQTGFNTTISWLVTSIFPIDSLFIGWEVYAKINKQTGLVVCVFCLAAGGNKNNPSALLVWIFSVQGQAWGWNNRTTVVL
jgi:hypothetical protein